MFDSLHLRSNVNIIGTKGKTVLKKCRTFSSKLSADLGHGHYDVSVEKPHLFKPGMGIYIRDTNGLGFYGTVATVTWKEGDRIGINRMLNHDYARIRNATVSTVFPVVSGYYVNNLGIEDITIDGNGKENDFIDGCRGGGIFLLQCHGVEIKGVTVKNYNGDGISFQQCTKLTIEECEVLNNYGSGLHPGSGSAGVIMRNCKIKGNRKDGVFYCLRVTYTLLENCEVLENRNDGISIGARDTDHIIRNNLITKNHGYGIYFRKADRVMGGHRNLINFNTIDSNCQKEGRAEVFIEDIT
ncbi:MAG: right-handed parallel beta-helix repeat-containing protein, partial [Candidatus Ratteibacteria bacterium]